jgi:aspartate kinase
MQTVVMKFGGVAVATHEHFSRIADFVLMRMSEKNRIVIVVSAMGDTTNQLIDLAKKVNADPPRRELDMLISVGERISISLLAMALAAKNQEAVSFTGSQSGIITCPRHTDARIVHVKPHRLLPHLDQNRIVIVAGFQGVSKMGEITTLGRGGSDTTAVALALALDAQLEIYKDVEGIFAEDPKINPNAPLYSRLTYGAALEIVSKGARVLHPRCIALAQKNGLPMHVRSFHDFYTHQSHGTLIEEKEKSRPKEPLYETDL